MREQNRELPDHDLRYAEKRTRVEEMIRSILEEDGISAEKKLYRYSVLHDALGDLLADSEMKDGDPAGHFMSYSEYAARYIRTHFREKIKINDLASHIGISRSYLVRIMRQQTGLSPQAYLIKVRMENAAELLLRSRDTIREIAADSGYDDALAFSKVFKRYFGVSPSEFRDRRR